MESHNNERAIRSLAVSIELIKNNTTYTRADGIHQCFNYRESMNSPCKKRSMEWEEDNAISTPCPPTS